VFPCFPILNSFFPTALLEIGLVVEIPEEDDEQDILRYDGVADENRNLTIEQDERPLV
jgi:hypothetical protein